MEDFPFPREILKPNPVLDAVLQRRTDILEEMKGRGYGYDNLENMIVLLKTNSFLFKKIAIRILKKTCGGYIYQSSVDKIYRCMYGLVKNLLVGVKELEDVDWSPATGLSVERDIRKARETGDRHFFRMSLTFSEYVDEDLLPWDELKYEIAIFSSLREQFHKVTTICAVFILAKAGLSVLYGPIVDGEMMFHTDDRQLIQYISSKYPDEFSDNP